MLSLLHELLPHTHTVSHTAISLQALPPDLHVHPLHHVAWTADPLQLNLLGDQTLNIMVGTAAPK